MLKKYQSFVKVSRTPQCSFYEAIIRQNNQKVLIKRIKQQCSWSQMLSCPSLKLQSKQYYFPKLIQIFKSKGSYFIVYQKPAGQNLTFQNQVQKKQIPEFYQLFTQICKALNDLKNQIKNVYVYPEWIFMHRNSIKICHFQPYFNKNSNLNNKDTQAHVFMYNIQNPSFSAQPKKQQSIDFERIKNINFNLGYIAYHLLTGKATDWEDDQEKYFKQIKQIQTNCRQQIINDTKDNKLAHLLQKLIKFEDIDQYSDSANQLFLQLFNFLKNKNKYLMSQRSNQSHRIVQVTMQKMSLFTKSSIIRSEKKKKSLRPCCINKTFQQNCNQEQSPQDNQYKLIDNNKLASKRKSFKRNFQDKIPKNSNSKFKFIDQFENKSHLNRQKINLSCFLPSLSTQRKISGIISNLNLMKPNKRKTMFRSAQKT